MSAPLWVSLLSDSDWAELADEVEAIIAKHAAERSRRDDTVQLTEAGAA